MASLTLRLCLSCSLVLLTDTLCPVLRQRSLTLVGLSNLTCSLNLITSSFNFWRNWWLLRPSHTCTCCSSACWPSGVLTYNSGLSVQTTNRVPGYVPEDDVDGDVERAVSSEVFHMQTGHYR